MIIAENVRSVLAEIPAGVELVAVAKTRTPQEVEEAIAAGAHIIGENYIQEAETASAAIGNKAIWHFIGRLQKKNKVKKASPAFRHDWKLSIPSHLHRLSTRRAQHWEKQCRC
jgi:uncharacterized pyridoxal phosphate-containing UPF0001 family protein